MLAVLSPAKRLDWTVETPDTATMPDFQKDANTLTKVARKLSVGDLRRLMHLSDDLARLNHDRFKSFARASDPETSKPAALAFAGDTYQGLEAATLSEDDLRWSQDHVRILSGLYGLLRPLDLIQPYRLEMGSRLENAKGKTLYAYWGSRLAKALDAQNAKVGGEVIVNCASSEYFGAVDLRALTSKVITPVFLEEKDGTAKTVGFFAKKARGAMARYMVEHRITDPKDLQGFDIGGYAFDKTQSEDTRWIFRRAYPQQQAAKARKRA